MIIDANMRGLSIIMINNVYSVYFMNIEPNTQNFSIQNASIRFFLFLWQSYLRIHTSNKKSTKNPIISKRISYNVAACPFLSSLLCIFSPPWWVFGFVEIFPLKNRDFMFWTTVGQHNCHSTVMFQDDLNPCIKRLHWCNCWHHQCKLRCSDNMSNFKLSLA